MIVGAGPTSCEYASELHDFITEDLKRIYPDLIEYISITIVEAGDDILGPFDQKLRTYVKKLFKSRNIVVKTSCAVKGVEEFMDPRYQQSTRHGRHNRHTRSVN